MNFQKGIFNNYTPAPAGRAGAGGGMVIDRVIQPVNH